MSNDNWLLNRMISKDGAVDGPKIDLILATYNGEEFLGEQLDSILGQTWTNIHILVNDDGSSDDTPNILSRYATQYPRQLSLGT